MKRAVVVLIAVIFATPIVLPAQDRVVSARGDRPDGLRRVLLIGAHPDDEDTNLIAWLQRGGHAETAYLSLTRGDGGQNLIGNELGEELGIIRTEELLAARRVDGAHQFFTRAYDFGFSKSADETYAHWPKDLLLDDVVTVVRSWRPHLIVAMFSGTPRDGHGQHQVAGILAREAYEAAGDTVRFPVSRFGPAWTPLKFYRTSRFAPDSATLRFNVGEYSAELRRSYAEVAGESRSQHKSQGFGALQRKGVVWNYVRREATRVNESTAASAERSIFDGLPSPGSEITAGGSPYADVAPHLALEAFANRRHLTLGDSARVTATLYNRSRRAIHVSPQSNASIRVINPPTSPVMVAPDSSFRWESWLRGRTITQPWWLTSPRTGDLFTPALPKIGSPDAWYSMSENEMRKETRVLALVSMQNQMASAQSALPVESPVVFRFLDPVRGDVQRPVAVVPALSVNLDRAHELARAGTQLERFFNVTLRSSLMRAQAVTVSLALPPGLSADSASRTLTLDSAGTRTVSFRVRGRLAAGAHTLRARATANGEQYSTGYIPIEYEHISPQRIYRPAELRLVAVDVRVPANARIAYIAGVGDNVATALDHLGIPVTRVEPVAIPTVDLAKFTAVIVGPRAYEASRELTDNNGYLLDYARAGGTLLVQYGQYEMMRPGVMPFPITINRPHDRVTEEVAPVTIIDASSPAIRKPNAITSTDFLGWVQERSLYMPRTFDERYRPVMEMNDAGATPNRGAILIAPYGAGLYVYTTIAFFRQLPGGVPGATRLFVNLLSMKRSDLAAALTGATR